MEILILQGPNINLIGVESSKVGERVTLDKINKGLRVHSHGVDSAIQLRFLQTHKAEKAISFIQRNRKKAQGIIFAPAAWGLYEYSILDTLKLSELPCVQVLLDENYGSLNESDSIYTSVCNGTITGHPFKAFIDAFDVLLKHLS